MPWGGIPAGKRPRVICPACGRDVVLRQDGAPKSHPDEAQFWTNCRGSGVFIAPRARALLERLASTKIVTEE